MHNFLAFEAKWFVLTRRNVQRKVTFKGKQKFVLLIRSGRKSKHYHNTNKEMFWDYYKIHLQYKHNAPLFYVISTHAVCLAFLDNFEFKFALSAFLGKSVLGDLNSSF